MYTIDNIQITDTQLDELIAQRNDPHRLLKECVKFDDRCRIEIFTSEWEYINDPSFNIDYKYRIKGDISPESWIVQPESNSSSSSCSPLPFISLNLHPEIEPYLQIALEISS